MLNHRHLDSFNIINDGLENEVGERGRRTGFSGQVCHSFKRGSSGHVCVHLYLTVRFFHTPPTQAAITSSVDSSSHIPAEPVESFPFPSLLVQARDSHCGCEGECYLAQLQIVFLSPSSTLYLPCYQILFMASFKLMASSGIAQNGVISEDPYHSLIYPKAPAPICLKQGGKQEECNPLSPSEARGHGWRSSTEMSSTAV